MQNLLVLLVCIFAGVALLVVVTERYGSPADEGSAARLQRWIMPLVGLFYI